MAIFLHAVFIPVTAYAAIFMQDQMKCTRTGYNTIEDRKKPLVLKELDLLWKRGRYSPSNTLLVDDSPYKAICNPVSLNVISSYLWLRLNLLFFYQYSHTQQYFLIHTIIKIQSTILQVSVYQYEHNNYQLSFYLFILTLLF